MGRVTCLRAGVVLSEASSIKDRRRRCGTAAPPSAYFLTIIHRDVNSKIHNPNQAYESTGSRVLAVCRHAPLRLELGTAQDQGLARGGREVGLESTGKIGGKRVGKRLGTIRLFAGPCAPAVAGPLWGRCGRFAGRFAEPLCVGLCVGHCRKTISSSAGQTARPVRAVGLSHPPKTALSSAPADYPTSTNATTVTTVKSGCILRRCCDRT